MWFHLCFFNHDPIGKVTLLDMARWVEAGLKEAGHTVTRSDNHCEFGAINIFWENFFPDIAKQIRESGIQYGIIATEIPINNRFNNRTDGNWVPRWESFGEVAKGAKFIWTMVEETIPFYSQFAPTAYLELGYTDFLLIKNDEAEDIDFVFWGLETDYRKKIIAQISKHATVCWPKQQLSWDNLTKLIKRTKIGLSFKQSQDWPVPSPTRIGRLLHAKKGIVIERTPVITRAANLTTLVSDGELFHEVALSKLSSNWKADAERSFEMYRNTMPMKVIMEEVLQKTLSCETGETADELPNRKMRLFFENPKELGSFLNGMWCYFSKSYGFVDHSLGEVNIIYGREILKKNYGDRVCFANSFFALMICLFQTKKNARTVFASMFSWKENLKLAVLVLNFIKLKISHMKRATFHD